MTSFLEDFCVTLGRKMLKGIISQGAKVCSVKLAEKRGWSGPRNGQSLAKGQLLQNRELKVLNECGVCMHQKPFARLADLCDWEGTDEPSLLSSLATLWGRLRGLLNVITAVAVVYLLMHLYQRAWLILGVSLCYVRRMQSKTEQPLPKRAPGAPFPQNWRKLPKLSPGTQIPLCTAMLATYYFPA